jgi:TusE/DsrC/DsvC family sulfur relay protein
VEGMGMISVKSKTIDVNENGFQANLDDWYIDGATFFAEAEGIRMTEQHWEVANYLSYYYKIDTDKALYYLFKTCHVASSLGTNKKWGWKTSPSIVTF